MIYEELVNKLTNVFINTVPVCKTQLSDTISNNGCGNSGSKIYGRESPSV